MSDGVLLLDGHTRSALAVARSLGRHGLSVTVAAEAQPCLAGCSKYSGRNLTCPSPMKQPEAFTGWLIETAEQNDYELILPMTDVSTVLAARIQAALPNLPVPSSEALDPVLDKLLLIRLASENQIPVPETWEVSQEDLQFPVIVKSRRSFTYQDGAWTEGGVKVVRNQQELISSYQSMDRPLVQEFIPGWGEGVFVLCNRGELRALFSHRRIRETPPQGGVSTLRESIPVDPRLVTPITNLLRKLKWHGPAMFEFRVDNRDGTPKLMEVNPRFWGSLHLAIISGLDFPWLLYRMVTEPEIETSVDYTYGARSRWLLGDFNRLLLAMKNLPDQTSYTGELMRFLRFDRRTQLEIESFDDPKPTFSEYRAYFLDMLRTISSRISPRSGKR